MTTQPFVHLFNYWEPHIAHTFRLRWLVSGPPLSSFAHPWGHPNYTWFLWLWLRPYTRPFAGLPVRSWIILFVRLIQSIPSFAYLLSFCTSSTQPVQCSLVIVPQFRRRFPTVFPFLLCITFFTVFSLYNCLSRYRWMRMRHRPLCRWRFTCCSPTSFTIISMLMILCCCSCCSFYCYNIIVLLIVVCSLVRFCLRSFALGEAADSPYIVELSVEVVVVWFYCCDSLISVFIIFILMKMCYWLLLCRFFSSLLKLFFQYFPLQFNGVLHSGFCCCSYSHAPQLRRRKWKWKPTSCITLYALLC